MPKSPTQLPSWDLSDLYARIDDPAMERDFLRAERLASTFAKTYRGRIAKTVTPKKLREVLDAYDQIILIASKPVAYAMLVHSTDCQNPENGALHQKVQARYVAIYQQIFFFELELLQHSTSDLKRFVREPLLLPYRHFLEKLIATKPHRLSEPEEKILNDKSLTGRMAFSRLFDQELSTKTFLVTRGTKVEKMNESQALDLLHDDDREVRKAAAEGITIGLKEELPRITFITNTLLQDKITEDRYRRYATPEEERHIANEIEQTVVDQMAHVVTQNYGLVAKYYTLKKRLLGFKTLYEYDRYAPLPGVDNAYTFAEAKAMILESFGRFSKKLAKTTEPFFERHWIDAEPKLGKRGGAFCYYVTPDRHPYVFVNFGGHVKDVLTLAHELGHGVNAMLARKQKGLQFDWPLTIAETSSVFGEMLVFDHLRQTITDPRAKLSLYMRKLEDIFATIFRQTCMYQFEQDLHAEARKNGELAPDRISEIWSKRQKEMFGSSVTLTSNYDVWWSYISHFIHSPFYVYAYAFGELLTLSLYAKYLKDGKAMVDTYLTFLSDCGSKSPQELVKPFGINLSDPTFWEGGIGIIREMLEEAKALAKTK